MIRRIDNNAGAVIADKSRQIKEEAFIIQLKPDSI